MPLHTNYCKRTIALQTAIDHCERSRPMNYCTNHCDRRQLLRRHPLRNPSPLRTPKSVLFCGESDSWGQRRLKHEKPINIIYIDMGGTLSGTNQSRPWDKQDLSLGQTEIIPGTNRPLSVELHSQIATWSCLSLGRVEVRPWDGWRFVPGTGLVPRGASEKCLRGLCLLAFFAPKGLESGEVTKDDFRQTLAFQFRRPLVPSLICLQSELLAMGLVQFS